MSVKKEKPLNLRSLILRKLLPGAVAAIMILGAMLFLPAGRLNWWEGWAFLTAYLLYLFFFAVWAVRNDPELLEERSQVATNAKGWDRAILTLAVLLLLGMILLVSLDEGRFHWTAAPAFLIGIGWFGLISSAVLIFWVIRTNTFASRFARIQEDRGQTVIRSGPYHYIRHPMYAGLILLFLCIPLSLGSMIGLIPGSFLVVLFCFRTGLEDRLLIRELPGYDEYTRSVRSRLFPGIW
jgi:protein-S-isoprenylcysteine O-methyltransferase Ste14